MSSEQRQLRPQQQKSAPRKKPLTREEEAARWRFWRNLAILTVCLLVLGYFAWVYVSPWLYAQLYRPTPLEEVTTEDVLVEFRDDPEAAARKYTGRRVVLEGKLLIEPPGGKQPGRLYYVVPGENGEETQITCEFFDTDDAQGVEPGEQVRLSGILKKVGPGAFKLEGAASQPAGGGQ